MDSKVNQVVLKSYHDEVVQHMAEKHRADLEHLLSIANHATYLHQQYRQFLAENNMTEAFDFWKFQHDGEREILLVGRLRDCQHYAMTVPGKYRHITQPHDARGLSPERFRFLVVSQPDQDIGRLITELRLHGFRSVKEHDAERPEFLGARA